MRRIRNSASLLQPGVFIRIKLSASSGTRQPGLIEGLQIWRAIAVLAVCALHTDQALRGAAKPSANLVRADNLGMFGVDIFFVISGFILGSTALRAASGIPRQEAWNFIIRRIMRIFPVYWIVILFALFRAVRLHRMTVFTFVDYWFLLPGLSFPGVQVIIGLAWTLIFEMLFYYTIALFMRFSLPYAVRNAIGALTLLVLVGQIINYRRPVLIVVMNPILLEFVFGGLAALAFQRFGKRRAAGILMLIAGILGTAVLTYRTTTNQAAEQHVLAGYGVVYRVASWGVVAGLLVSGVIFWGPQITSHLGRFMVAVGNGSYSIYLVSAVAIEMISRLFSHLPFHNTLRAHARMQHVIELACVMLAGMIVFWTIERPLGKWLHSKYGLVLKRRMNLRVPTERA